MFDTLREFLVKIGFQTDDSSLGKMLGQIGRVTLAAAELGATLEAAAAGAVAAFAGATRELERLYFMSERTKSSVAGIRGMSFAGAQLGSSTDAVQGSLENLARFVYSNPAAKGILRSMGVSTVGGSAGEMLQLGAVFQTMEPYLALRYANLFGIDYKTLRALESGRYNEQVARFNKLIGENPAQQQQAASAAHRFWVQLRDFGPVFEGFTDEMVRAFGPALTADLRRVQNDLIAHRHTLADVIGGVLDGLIKIGDLTTRFALATGDLVMAAVGWFDKLSPSAKTAVKEIGGLIIAWRLLNSAFLTSPLGIVLSLGAGLVLLWQDYETWKEGGKSLIDWSKWKPDVDRALDAIKQLGDGLDHIAAAIGGWQTVFEGVAAFLATKWLVSVLATIGKVAGAAMTAARAIAGIGGGAGAAATGGGSGLAFNAGVAVAPALPAIGLGAAAVGMGLADKALFGGNVPPAVWHRMGYMYRNMLSGFMPNKFGAAAAASAMGAQSGVQAINEKNPAIPGTLGGFGILQWTGSRRKMFFDWMHAQHLNPNSVPDELKFFKWDLKTNYPDIYQHLLHARSLKEAEYWFQKYEGTPGGPAFDARFASQLMRGNGAVNVTASPTIHVHGSGDPQLAAGAVLRGQDRVNSRLLRNSKANVN